MNQPIPLVVLAPIFISAIVLWLVIRRIKLKFAVETHIDFGKLRQFADEAHLRVGEYMRGNYSGDPTMLPQVLGILLTELETQARARDLPVTREMLKALLLRSASTQHIARANELREAMAEVA